jgi:hypothetical protein
MTYIDRTTGFSTSPAAPDRRLAPGGPVPHVVTSIDRSNTMEVQGLRIVPWPDAGLDAAGHDPRATYARRFWLPTLGPSTLLLMALLVERLEREPHGFALDPPGMSRMLGLGASDSKHAPFARSMLRLARFNHAELRPDRDFAVRRRLPSLTQRQVVKLPEDLAAQHDAFLAARPRVAAPMPRPIPRSA